MALISQAFGLAVRAQIWSVHIIFPARACPKPAPQARPRDRKLYRCLRDERPSKPYRSTECGPMDVTKPYEFIWFGDIEEPTPYKSTGFRWAVVSRTPVLWRLPTGKVRSLRSRGFKDRKPSKLGLRTHPSEAKQTGFANPNQGDVRRTFRTNRRNHVAANPFRFATKLGLFQR